MFIIYILYIVFLLCVLTNGANISPLCDSLGTGVECNTESMEFESWRFRHKKKSNPHDEYDSNFPGIG